ALPGGARRAVRRARVREPPDRRGVALGARRAARARGGGPRGRGRTPEAPLGRRRPRDDDRTRPVPLRGRGARPGPAAVAAPAQTMGVRTACGAPFEESMLIA